MAVRTIYDKEDEDVVLHPSVISASEAQLPAYLHSQAQGAEAALDIIGLESPGLSSYKEKQSKELGRFQTQFPEGLFDTKDKIGWWQEKATLNALNQAVPFLGYTVGTILQGIPYGPAKLLGSAINLGTFASQYNANFADTLQEHEERAGRPLTDTEKGWSAIISGGVVLLDRVVPGRVAKDIAKTFKKGGIKATRASIIKTMNSAKQNLSKSLATGVKYVGGKALLETGTEGTQKVLQIGTSVDPGYLFTEPGFESVVEEAAVAGPTAGMLSTPGAVVESTSYNRNISRARNQAKEFNRLQKVAAADISRETDIDVKAKYLIDIPDKQTLPAKSFEAIKKYTGVDVPKGMKTIGDLGIFKPMNSLLEARDRQTSGKAYNILNRIVQNVTPVGSFSQEEQIVDTDFFTAKDLLHGELYKEVNNILNKYSKGVKLTGQMFQKLPAEVNDYIREAMRDKSVIGKRPDLVSTKDLNTIRDKLTLAGQYLKEETGSGIVENYLHNPVSKEKVQGNREGFIRGILASSKIAYYASQKRAEAAGREFNPAKFIYQEDPVKARNNAELIADDIIQGRDPNVVTSKFIKDQYKREREGEKKESFEKSRSEEWENLPNEFRETNVGDILEGYLSKAATRIASARIFGSKNADKLQKDLTDLVKMGDESGEQVITQEEVDRVWDVYDAAHNVYRRDVPEWERNWRVASKAATTVAAITHLGLATFSSLSELVWIAERAGMSNMLLTLPDALAYTFKGIGQGISGNAMKPGEGATVLANLGFNLNPKMNERLDQLFSTDRSNILNMYFRSPFGAFLTQWTNFNRNWAAQAGMSMMNRRAKGLVNDSIDSMDKRRLLNELKENGIALEDFKTIAELSKDDKGNININVTDENYINKQFTKSDGTVTRVRDVLLPWVHKIVNDIVVHPVASNKPLWMSDPSLTTIAQLKTFPIVFGNTVMKRIIRKVRPSACGADFGLALSAISMMAAAIGVAYIGESIKASIRQQDERDLTWVDAGNITGMLGAGGLVVGSRYGDLTTSLLGPAFKAINKAHSDVLLPFLDPEAEDYESFGNLIDWSRGAINSGLGPAGMYFTPLGESE